MNWSSGFSQKPLASYRDPTSGPIWLLQKIGEPTGSDHADAHLFGHIRLLSLTSPQPPPPSAAPSFPLRIEAVYPLCRVMMATMIDTAASAMAPPNSALTPKRSTANPLHNMPIGKPTLKTVDVIACSRA